MDAEWIQVTLQDAAEALQELLEDLEDQPEDAEALLREQLPAVYAKLNYAWHTRDTGPAAIDTMDHDALVSWPQELGLNGKAP